MAATPACSSSRRLSIAMAASCPRNPTALAPTQRPACVPKELLANTTRSTRSARSFAWASSSSRAATNPTAPTAFDAPTGMRYGRFPAARACDATSSATASRVRSPENTTCAPSR